MAEKRREKNFGKKFFSEGGGGTFFWGIGGILEKRGGGGGTRKFFLEKKKKKFFRVHFKIVPFFPWGPQPRVLGALPPKIGGIWKKKGFLGGSFSFFFFLAKVFCPGLLKKKKKKPFGGFFWRNFSQGGNQKKVRALRIRGKWKKGPFFEGFLL